MRLARTGLRAWGSRCSHGSLGLGGTFSFLTNSTFLYTLSGVVMAFARRRRPEPNETALVAAIDAKLARLAPAIHSREEQRVLVLTWINELLDQRIEVTRWPK